MEMSDVIYQERSEPFLKGQDHKIVVFSGFISFPDVKNVAFQFIEEFSDKNISLIIDNSPPSLWRPKDIQKYSIIPEENEVLYPSVAKVLSKSVKKTYNYVYARNLLLCNLPSIGWTKILKDIFFKKLRGDCPSNWCI